ncbi:MORN motif [Ostreococcus tauri]|uniref:MORN motif n=1 Tax=Ostreococcus tauri TaxID=70448 RepID=A0A090M6D4_OSTTA|nr:MORN motif [Ostreococcus tauri]CEF99756.1 MORN motif [Ostreococcus tauri]|eukprot:XP_022840014.1 MORN motif [Ostreococcus tauri]
MYTDGVMHGYGVYTWSSDDSMYFGEWKNNSQNGCGVKLYGSGAVEVGEWKDDQYLGEYTGRCGEDEQDTAMFNAMKAANRARMFTNKPDGEVTILKNIARPEESVNNHPVVYEGGTEWMMPGYKGEQYEPPADFAEKNPVLYSQMKTFNKYWERAWRYYNIDVPEDRSDAKSRELKFLTDEPQELRVVDEDYDEYDDADEEEDEEEDQPAARSRRAGPAAMSISLRRANPVAQAFSRLGKSKQAIRMNPLRAAKGAFEAARERVASACKVTFA